MGVGASGVHASMCFHRATRARASFVFFLKLHALDGIGSRARQKLATEGVEGSNNCYMVGPEHQFRGDKPIGLPLPTQLKNVDRAYLAVF